MEENKEILSITVNEDGKEKIYSVDIENGEYIFTCEYENDNEVTEYEMNKKTEEEYKETVEEIKNILSKW